MCPLACNYLDVFFLSLLSSTDCQECLKLSISLFSCKLGYAKIFTGLSPGKTGYLDRRMVYVKYNVLVHIKISILNRNIRGLFSWEDLEVKSKKLRILPVAVPHSF